MLPAPVVGMWTWRSKNDRWSLLDDVRSLIGVDTDVAGGGDHWKLLPSWAWLLGRMEARKAGISGTVHCSVPVAMPVSRASHSVGQGSEELLRPLLRQCSQKAWPLWPGL